MVGQVTLNLQPLDPATAVRNDSPEPGFIQYRDSSQIEYTSEEALRQGLGIVAAINAQVEQLELGNLRRDVWGREITK